MTLPTWAIDVQRTFNARLKDEELVIRTCPYCNNTHWNFQINHRLCVFNCWVCNRSGSVKTFLRDSGIEFDFKDIVVQRRIEKKYEDLSLPHSHPLLHVRSKAADLAREKLVQRGMTMEMIEEWEIGLCTGEDRYKLKFDYAGYTVAPLYGIHGLEYFNAYNYLKGGYKLPPIGKDVFVPKRRGSRRLVIVEGFFDATAVWRYTSYDVMMLLGKYLMKNQTQMLKKINYDEVILCLDEDAFISTTLKLAWRLYKEGVSIRIVHLPKNTDPNDLQEKVVLCIAAGEIYNELTSVQNKLSRIKEL